MSIFNQFFNLAQGPAGTNGTNGTDGGQGIDGIAEQGDPGVIGAPGPDGFGALLNRQGIDMGASPGSQWVTVIPSNGTGPYTYIWNVTIDFGDPGDVTVTPTATEGQASVEWVTGLQVGGTVYCTVTDTSNMQEARCHTDYFSDTVVIPPAPTSFIHNEHPLNYSLFAGTQAGTPSQTVRFKYADIGIYANADGTYRYDGFTGNSQTELNNLRIANPTAGFSSLKEWWWEPGVDMVGRFFQARMTITGGTGDIGSARIVVTGDGSGWVYIDPSDSPEWFITQYQYLAGGPAGELLSQHTVVGTFEVRETTGGGTQIGSIHSLPFTFLFTRGYDNKRVLIMDKERNFVGTGGSPATYRAEFHSYTKEIHEYKNYSSIVERQWNEWGIYFNYAAADRYDPTSYFEMKWDLVSGSLAGVTQNAGPNQGVWTNMAPLGDAVNGIVPFEWEASTPGSYSFSYSYAIRYTSGVPGIRFIGDPLARTPLLKWFGDGHALSAITTVNLTVT